MERTKARIIGGMAMSDPKPEIKPTLDHLSDPYVLQLIEAIAQRDDRIEELERDLDNERARGIHTCHSKCQRPLCVAHRRIAELEGENERWKKQHESDVLYYSGLEKTNADFLADNERLRTALQRIVDEIPPNQHKKWHHHHHYLVIARKALAAVEGDGDD
jgi:hypothetical protein